MAWFGLCGFALLAGLVDSVAGGGGLIQLPALLLLLPPSQVATVAPVLGTNKLSSFCGTGVAALQYSRRIPLNRRFLLPMAATAFASAFLGAWAVSQLARAVVRPVILGLLVAVAASTFFRKDFGRHHTPRLSMASEVWIGVGIGSVVGFYDGFFGPGTGSFLIFAFISVFGFDFITSSASAKVVNVATNLSALAWFAASGNILYVVALPMGVCNVIGSLVGTHLAILKGNRFVRSFFLVVVVAMILKYGWEVFR